MHARLGSCSLALVSQALVMVLKTATLNKGGPARSKTSFHKMGWSKENLRHNAEILYQKLCRRRASRNRQR
eukprot:4526949-Karenia_brevis.AAC.1